MAVELGGPEQSWVAWALGGVATAGSVLLGLVRGESRKGQNELWGHVDDLKRDYVRRDDIGTHLAPINAKMDAIASDIGTTRKHVHEIANAVAKLEGRQERRERGGQ